MFFNPSSSFKCCCMTVTILVSLSHAGDNLQLEALCLAGGYAPSCLANEQTRDGIFCTAAMGIVYFIVTCYILLYKLRQFRKLPYAEIQVAVVFYRLQVCTSILTLKPFFIVTCCILLYKLRQLSAEMPCVVATKTMAHVCRKVYTGTALLCCPIWGEIVVFAKPVLVSYASHQSCCGSHVGCAACSFGCGFW